MHRGERRNDEGRKVHAGFMPCLVFHRVGIVGVVEQVASLAFRKRTYRITDIASQVICKRKGERVIRDAKVPHDAGYVEPRH
jgi:hypothetical protein